MEDGAAVQSGPARQRLSAAGLLVETITQIPGLVVPMLAGIYGTRNTEIGALPVIAAVLAFGLIARAMAWLRHYYTISEDDVHIEKGLISHTARSIPFERIVDVTIEQPALARLLGLAVVRFETGSGEGDEAALRYVSEAEAERLRQTVRTRKAGGQALAVDPADEAADVQVLFAMNPRRIVTLGFYSFSLVIFGVLLGLSAKFDFLLPDWEAWVALAESQGEEVGHLSLGQQGLGLIGALAALIAIGIITGIIRVALRDWGFVLERTAKGLRRRRGLLTHTDMTKPLTRVQRADIGTGAIRSRHGWHWLHLVSMADAGEEKYDQLVAPLAQLEEIWAIVREAGLNPPGEDLGFVRPSFAPGRDWIVLRSLALAVIGLALQAFGLPYAWAILLPIIWFALRDWLNWRLQFHAIDADQLYLKTGWWTRFQVIARQINVQSVSLASGPLERRHGLAFVHFGIANGSMSFGPIPLAEAAQIREQVLGIAAPVDFSELNRPH